MATDKGMPRPVCYSTSLGYVFIHIPKCAGTSIHHALGILHDRLALPINEKKYHKHSKASDVRRVLGPIWDKSFKFSIVRNPWDLMVSSYHWWLTHAGQYSSLATQTAQIKEMGSFAKFMQSEFGSKMINEQYGGELLDWISEDGKIVVDLVGRFETLNRDWIRISEALGVDHISLSRANASTRDDYRSFYDETSKRLVAERFRRTIKFWLRILKLWRE